MSYNYTKREEKTTQLMDINEKVQELIVENLKMSEILYMQGRTKEAYRSIKNVFWKIAPFDFENKSYLIQCTNQIDAYFEEIDSQGGKVDMQRMIMVNQQKVQLHKLIDEYFQLIPFCLKELGLYLRIIKRTDDYDEMFSEQTFTTNESLLDHKKKELATTTVDVFIKCMTPRQVHDVHARLLTYKDKGGMKRLSIGDDDNA